MAVGLGDRVVHRGRPSWRETANRLPGPKSTCAVSNLADSSSLAAVTDYGAAMLGSVLSVPIGTFGCGVATFYAVECVLV